MKYLVALLVPAEPENAETVTSQFSLEVQDARLLAERIQPLLDGMQARIEAPDAHTWIATGPRAEVSLIRIMSMAYDVPLLTPEHVGLVYEIEHQDPRQLTNSVRGRADWGERWIVVSTSAPRWYAMIPRTEVEAFEAVLEDVDRPR